MLTFTAQSKGVSVVKQVRMQQYVLDIFLYVSKIKNQSEGFNKAKEVYKMTIHQGIKVLQFKSGKDRHIKHDGRKK